MGDGGPLARGRELVAQGKRIDAIIVLRLAQRAGANEPAIALLIDQLEEAIGPAGREVLLAKMQSEPDPNAVTFGSGRTGVSRDAKRLAQLNVDWVTDNPAATDAELEKAAFDAVVCLHDHATADALRARVKSPRKADEAAVATLRALNSAGGPLGSRPAAPALAPAQEPGPGLRVTRTAPTELLVADASDPLDLSSRIGDLCRKRFTDLTILRSAEEVMAVRGSSKFTITVGAPTSSGCPVIVTTQHPGGLKGLFVKKYRPEELVAIAQWLLDALTRH